ncbi:MAG: tyrosine-type recombinase/integrase [Oscillospiraceae bacterium]|nr:tyrosine-type recombinase/integrase [Oscillospiraceae bacterium]
MGYSNCQETQLAVFDAYFHEHHPNLALLTKEAVRGWIYHETSHGCGGMNAKASSVRNLAQYMGNGAYILPHKAIPKPHKCTPYILTDDELSRLFFAADNIKGNIDKLVKVILPTLLRLLYTCGLRPYEVRLIKRNNINFSTGEILLERTKKHKERIVVMSDDMLEQCRKYDIIRAITNPQSEYFFTRKDGKPVQSRQLDYIVKRCWRKANPDVPPDMLPRLRPYDLRHRYASAILQKWISEKRDLYAMQPYLRAYMGHEEFDDTAYYIHLLPENLLNSPGIDWSDIDEVNPEVNVWKN